MKYSFLHRRKILHLFFTPHSYCVFSTDALMRIRRVFSHFSHWFETDKTTWSLCTFFYSFPSWCALNPPNVRKERFVADLLVYVYPVAVIITAHRVRFASMYILLFMFIKKFTINKKIRFQTWRMCWSWNFWQRYFQT